MKHDRPRAATVESTLDLVIEAAKRLKHDVGFILEQAHRYERGFPASTLGGGPGESDSSRTENQAVARIAYRDEDGIWHNPPADPWADVNDWCAELKEAMSLILIADSHRAALMPKGMTEEDEKTGHGVFCLNCAKHEQQKAAEPGKAGRCEACYRYRLRTGDDRPRELVLKDEQRREKVS